METINYSDIIPILGIAIMGAILLPSIVTVFKTIIKMVVGNV